MSFRIISTKVAENDTVIAGILSMKFRNKLTDSFRDKKIQGDQRISPDFKIKYLYNKDR